MLHGIDIGSPSTGENWLGNLPANAAQRGSALRDAKTMASDEHLGLLRRGTTIWNEWRRSFPLDRRPDLKGATLAYEDLQSANLSNADLTDADLSHAKVEEANLFQAILRTAKFEKARLGVANLQNADLTDADLAGADLAGASFLWAKLSGANLQEAILAATNFTEAELSASDLSKAFLYNTIFGNTDLSKTIGLDKCMHIGPSIIDVRTLNLSENLPLSFLRGCGLPDNLIAYLPSLRSDPIKFYSCFISYSDKDQLFAERLHADLQDKGVPCWFAPRDLPIGAKIWDAIDEAIRVSDKLLVILSEASIASDWVEAEVSKAFADEHERKRTILHPIRIDDAVKTTSEAWARRLRDQRNIGDFRQWAEPAEYQKSLERLLRDLKKSATE